MVETRQAYLVTFGFDQALRAMKVGFRVKRIEGDGKTYKYVDGYIVGIGKREPIPSDARYPVLSFSTEDILAYDWVIVLSDSETLLTGIDIREVVKPEIEPVDG